MFRPQDMNNSFAAAHKADYQAIQLCKNHLV